jgi:hypothetical protein
MRDTTSEVCGEFYEQRSDMLTQYRSERAIAQPFTGMDDRIIVFRTAFDDLQKTLDSRIILDTALVLSRTTVTIDMISAYRFR